MILSVFIHVQNIWHLQHPPLDTGSWILFFLLDFLDDNFEEGISGSSSLFSSSYSVIIKSSSFIECRFLIELDLESLLVVIYCDSSEIFLCELFPPPMDDYKLI